MNRKLRMNRLFQILYPLLVYIIFYQAMDFVFLLLIGGYVSALTCLWLSALVTLVPMITIYRNAPTVKNKDAFQKTDLKKDGMAILLVVAIGVGLNLLVTYFQLIPDSSNYEAANRVLYSGSTVIKILCNAITIPILEEFLYRGIIAGQLEVFYNKKIAILFSAILFGALHFNVVQFVYAFICGIALGYIYLKDHKIWVPIVAHGMTNLVVILATL